VRNVKGQIPPYVRFRQRDSAICREAQLEERFDTSAAPFQRGHELPRRNAVVIHTRGSRDAVLTSQRRDPPASGVVKMRANRADCTLRRPGNCHIPERRRQTLDELDRDPVIRSPGGKKARLEVVRWRKPQMRQLPLKELQIVLRQRIRVLHAKSLVRELPTSGAPAGPQARDGSGTQRRCQPMAGLLEHRTSQISNASIDRRGLGVSASPLERHAEESERLNLMPFGQSILGGLVTLGREAVEKIDSRVVTALFCSLERFSHSVVEPGLIRAPAFMSHHVVLRPWALSIPH
jgi:hypothetical protein